MNEMAGDEHYNNWVATNFGNGNWNAENQRMDRNVISLLLPPAMPDVAGSSIPINHNRVEQFHENDQFLLQNHRPSFPSYYSPFSVFNPFSGLPVEMMSSRKWDFNQNASSGRDIHYGASGVGGGSPSRYTAGSSSQLSLTLTAPTGHCHEEHEGGSSPSSTTYLAVVQEMLSEIAKYSVQNVDPSTLLLSCPADDGGGGGSSNPFCGPPTAISPADAESKRKHLLALLQAVDDRYSQCLEELHMVVSAFHAATDHPASTTTSTNSRRRPHLALQTVSFWYKNLRERIGNFILAVGEQCGSSSNHGGGVTEEERSLEASLIQKQWAVQQLRKKEQQQNHLWRPQRGLPERSVAVLRAWMFQNFLHPYPKDTEKHLLAVKSGLTRSQVSNWFINARVRLWKPMIEEMYAEMNRKSLHHTLEEINSNAYANQIC
ncbi:unnamed protein product [Cuscuta epithymum]|uniref:Homeobox domain-containing protein n=1 Tax=Cuscuta epithymum TaxID=186058 RepID=A0AAV0C4U6_9ASTE|nr:unnamed protein product [Cuscuta epithymum]